MNRKQHLLKILSTISILVIVIPALAACGSAALVNQINNGKITICHATTNALSPYDELTLGFNELVAHANHKEDIIPAPAGGCPKVAQAGNNTGNITICHATDDLNQPYSKITVDFNGLLAHATHQQDIIPAPQNGCPLVTLTPPLATTVTATTTATATITGTPATATITPTVTATPVGTTTPAAATAGAQGAKITICHATGSAKNPYVMITIDVNGLNGHRNHPRDIIPAPAGGCPGK